MTALIDRARRGVDHQLNALRRRHFAQGSAYASISSIEASDADTVVMHLKQADNFLLTNLSTGAIGIVPEGSGREFWQRPVGTGRFDL